MSKRFMDGPPVETYSVEERVAILEREVNELLDSGAFRLKGGVGYLSTTLPGPAPACGCAVGALVQALGGRGDRGIFATATDTGLITLEELGDLEQGYECGRQRTTNGRTASGPFFEFGRRLRARPDADPSWQRKTPEHP